MSDRFYVRIRGRVHGPMPLTKLQTLAARGQLSRIHEISTDGQTWQAASRMPELFTSSQPTNTATQPAATTGGSTLVQTAAGHSQPEPNLQATTANFDPWTAANPTGVDSALVDDGADPSETWYYAIDSAQQGPVPRAELVSLIRAGTLSSQDMVWKSDLENWIEAGNVATLQPLFAQVKQSQEGNGSVASGASTASTVSALGDAGDATLDTAILGRLLTCRHWIHLSMIGAFVLSVLFALAGIMSVLSALLASKMTILVAGILQLVYSGLFTWLGAMLMNLNASIKVAETTMAPTSLIDAVESLRPTFKSLVWLFLITTGILVILLVVLILIAAVGGDLLDGLA